MRSFIEEAAREIHPGELFVQDDLVPPRHVAWG